MSEAIFIRNAWYMAGWSEELGQTMLARRIFDRPMVFFRAADGAVAALEDRCPHRFAPLSLGTRDGDTIVCGYHGLAFDYSGACVRNPFSDRIPPAAKVASWAAVERHDIIWVWGGEPRAADPATIPDFAFVADMVGRKVLRGYTMLEAPYEYATDNLLDLSHIEFVHKGSLAGEGVIFAGKHEVIDEGETLHSNWWMPGVSAPMHTRGVYPEELITDHWLDMRWNAPASMRLDVGAVPAGQPRSAGFVVVQAHIVTPATPTTAHYFNANPRHHDVDSAETDVFLRALFARAFDEEDKPMIKAAYDNLEGRDFWAAKPISLGIDAGGTRARRKIEAMLRQEAAAS